MSEICPTVAVKADNDDGYMIINKSDVRTRTVDHTSYKRPKYVGFYNSPGSGNDGLNDFYIDGQAQI